MKHTASRFGLLAALSLLVCLLFVQAAYTIGSPVRKIVVFRQGATHRAAAAALSRHGATQTKALSLINGAVVYLPNEAAARGLAADVTVASVEDDVVVRMLAKPAPVQPSQTIPWGISAISAPEAWSFATGDPIKVGVIDTGIDTTHPDLAPNLKGGVSCVAYTSKYTDDNGHGTHVAGIVAAVNDAYGVVGVAPRADLYAIKVLDRRGSGYLSDIIEGLDWAVDNGMDVVNMSLGTNSYSPALALAVQNTAAAGVVQVAAAGNDGPGDYTVDYPGAFPEVIAVGATAEGGSVASFSSRGPQVAVAAPGVNVLSTYKGRTYRALSGTSMASPHVAGTVALMLNNGVGPSQVRAKLSATALDLGAPGVDHAYGAGFVRANLAIAP